MTRTAVPIEDRFWNHVMPEPMSGCWLWLGGTSNGSYGNLHIKGTDNFVYAHRFSYELHKGAIPPELEIDHLCRNTLRVNPDHLEAVTRRENVLRGRCPAAMQARQTHCKNGHLLSGDNIYASGRKRICKVCFQAGRARRRREKRKA